MAGNVTGAFGDTEFQSRDSQMIIFVFSNFKRNNSIFTNEKSILTIPFLLSKEVVP
jgi:hypothetical protein